MKEPKGMARLQITMGHKEDGEESEYDKYELEDACRTLERAAEIKADEKLMQALGPYLDKKVKTIKSVASLRKKAREKILKDA